MNISRNYTRSNKIGITATKLRKISKGKPFLKEEIKYIEAPYIENRS